MHFVQIKAPSKEIRDRILAQAIALEPNGELKVLSFGRTDEGDDWTFCFVDTNTKRPSFGTSGEFGRRGEVDFVVEVLTVPPVLSFKCS